MPLTVQNFYLKRDHSIGLSFFEDNFKVNIYENLRKFEGKSAQDNETKNLQI